MSKNTSRFVSIPLLCESYDKYAWARAMLHLQAMQSPTAGIPGEYSPEKAAELRRREALGA